MTRVAILGGGPAGVGGAFRLRRLELADVVLFERNARFGGNAGSFELAGHRLDFGSHRLHPACDPAILADVRGLLGDDLLDRPRHGRIRLLGKWVHFPLKPADLLLHLDKSFAAGSLADAVRKVVAKPDEGTTFASVLEANLGRTICEHFYFPYAVKLWGHAPQALSGIQAKKRVAAGSFTKLLRKVLSAVPGLKPPGAGRFFYPRRGFGQISDAYAARAAELGADLRLSTSVTELVPPAHEKEPWRLTAERAGASERFEFDRIFSTVPLTVLVRALGKHAPATAVEAARAIDYRAMILVYLELPVAQFTEYDAHYFPGADVSITRLSEPKNYAARSEPAGTTILCAELPCMRDDAVWNTSDAELGSLVVRDLEHSGLTLPAAPTAVTTQRLPQAYPIYLEGYEEPFGVLDRFVSSLPRFTSYGRQGLFAHDNTHHALAMAYAAADCLTNGRFDDEAWSRHRAVFAKHVVED